MLGQPPAPSPLPDASNDAADILASDMCIVQRERGREQGEVRRTNNVKRRKKRRRRRRKKMMSSRMMEMWTKV